MYCPQYVNSFSVILGFNWTNGFVQSFLLLYFKIKTWLLHNPVCKIFNSTTRKIIIFHHHANIMISQKILILKATNIVICFAYTSAHMAPFSIQTRRFFCVFHTNDVTKKKICFFRKYNCMIFQMLSTAIRPSFIRSFEAKKKN